MVHRQNSLGGYNSVMDIRVGHGFDLHRLGTPEDGAKPMIIGGVRIESPVGPIAHSDGDAVLHAVTDALLGAIGDSDLGTLFPNTSADNAGRDSKEFLCEAVHRVSAEGWAIGNVDITVLCDVPKIGPHRDAITASLRSLLGAPVSIKGKTHEETGRAGAIEVHVVALVQRGIHT